MSKSVDAAHPPRRRSFYSARFFNIFWGRWAGPHLLIYLFTHLLLFFGAILNRLKCSFNTEIERSGSGRPVNICRISVGTLIQVILVCIQYIFQPYIQFGI